MLPWESESNHITLLNARMLEFEISSYGPAKGGRTRREINENGVS